MILKVHLIYLLKINLRKEKLLVASIYNAPSQKNKYFIWYLTNLLEFYSTRHEKVIILGDFNKNTENKVMKDFLREDTFYSLMKQNTCFKGDEGFVHRFANFKFEIFVYEDKLLSNWFEWSSSYDVYFSENKIWTKEIIPQFQTSW